MQMMAAINAPFEQNKKKTFELLHRTNNIHFPSIYFTGKQQSSWPAVSLLLQNVLIFLGSLVFKFGRNEEVY